MPTAPTSDLILSLDKDTPYEQGETMTLTVKTPPGDRDVYVIEPFTVHVEVPDRGLEGDATGQLNRLTGAKAPISTSDAAHVWTLQSDDGNEAVYTATA
jgi:hypothetical protein